MMKPEVAISAKFSAKKRGRVAYRETFMHPSTNNMLIIIVTGVALMLLGFGLRDRNIGMGLMGIGLITAIGTIIYKAYITFY